MHLNIGDLIVGGGFVVTGLIFLRHFRNQTITAHTKRLRLLSLAMIISGFALIFWRPMWTLAAAG